MPSLTKFQLPALDLKFGSLTEGTDIPPPPPSPKEEDPSASAQQQQQQQSVGNKSSATNNGTQTTPDVQRNGINSAATPLSPKGRAPSIRRLFSRNKLSEAYHANAAPITGDSMFPRPVSQSNASIATDGQPKRSSGWFRRLRGSDGIESRRSSKFFSSENTKPISSTAQKPPPMIPEIKGDDGGSLGSLGSDLFKDI